MMMMMVNRIAFELHCINTHHHQTKDIEKIWVNTKTHFYAPFLFFLQWMSVFMTIRGDADDDVDGPVYKHACIMYTILTYECMHSRIIPHRDSVFHHRHLEQKKQPRKKEKQSVLQIVPKKYYSLWKPSKQVHHHRHHIKSEQKNKVDRGCRCFLHHHQYSSTSHPSISSRYNIQEKNWNNASEQSRSCCQQFITLEEIFFFRRTRKKYTPVIIIMSILLHV